MFRSTTDRYSYTSVKPFDMYMYVHFESKNIHVPKRLFAALGLCLVFSFAVFLLVRSDVYTLLCTHYSLLRVAST